MGEDLKPYLISWDLENEITDLDNINAAACKAYAIAKFGLKVESGEEWDDPLLYETFEEAYEDIANYYCIEFEDIKFLIESFRENKKARANRANYTFSQHDRFDAENLREFCDKMDENMDRLGLLQTCAGYESGVHWLPDLGTIWKQCEAQLHPIPNMAEFQIPVSLKNRLVKNIEEQDIEINEVGETALVVTMGQQFVVPFCYLPRIKMIIPYIKAVNRYLRVARILEKDLQDHFYSADSGHSYQRSDDYSQKIYKEIQKGTYDPEPAIDSKLFTSRNKARFVRAIRDKNWSGINKSIFRDDALLSAVQQKLNLTKNRTSWIEPLLICVTKSDENFIELEPCSITPDKSATGSQLSRNVLFFGAPGTGKSHSAKRYIACDEKHLHRTVFFADYQNSDFIGALKPVSRAKTGISYEFEPGPMIVALKDALEHPHENVVLLVEELNRGNAPAIFGEMFQLLDRKETGESEYSIKIPESLKLYFEKFEKTKTIEKLSWPANLFVLATMNSSDQGVFPLDAAFKRRWHFKYMPIDFDTAFDKNQYRDNKIKIEGGSYSWPVFATSVNEILSEKFDMPEDRLLGPYFLSPTELLADDLTDFIAEKVFVYLWEDVLRYDGRDLFFSPEIKTFGDLQNRLRNGAEILAEELKDRLNENSGKQNSPDRTETGPEDNIESGNTEENSNGGSSSENPGEP